MTSQEISKVGAKTSSSLKKAAIKSEEGTPSNDTKETATPGKTNTKKKSGAVSVNLSEEGKKLSKGMKQIEPQQPAEELLLKTDHKGVSPDDEFNNLLQFYAKKLVKAAEDMENNTEKKSASDTENISVPKAKTRVKTTPKTQLPSESD